MFRKSIFSLTACALALSAATMTSGCIPLIFAGAAAGTGTAVSTLTDRRSAGAIVNDGVLEKRVSWEISQALGTGVTSHIEVTSYRGRVLLSGEVGTEEAKALAETTARNSLDVGAVINELAVMPNSGMVQRMSDSSTATKIRSRFVANKEVSINQMKVVVERDIVYLMGVVTPEENKTACEIAATSGVQKVISLVQIMTPEQIEAERLERERLRKQQELLKESQSMQ